MSRNQSRVSANTPEPPAIAEQPMPPNIQPQGNPFNFIVPTEVVDLPSKGEYYGINHPLRGVSTIEIKHMTAKEEDILSSKEQGIHTFLIGESFMREPSPGEALREILV